MIKTTIFYIFNAILFTLLAFSLFIYSIANNIMINIELSIYLSYSITFIFIALIYIIIYGGNCNKYIVIFPFIHYLTALASLIALAVYSKDQTYIPYRNFTLYLLCFDLLYSPINIITFVNTTLRVRINGYDELN